MPTKKPRISVTVEPEAYALLSTYAELTEQSMGGVIGGLVNESLPHLAPIIKMLEKAKNAPDEFRKQVIEKLESDKNTLEKALFEASQTDFINEEKQR